MCQSQQKSKFFMPAQGNRTSNTVNYHGRQAQDKFSIYTDTDCDDKENKDKITSLHKLLEIETDKINKWKTSSQMELRQKDAAVEDSRITIDCLRKSNVSLQIQNENLGVRIENETKERENTNEKITGTREMCLAVSDYFKNIQKAIDSVNQEKEKLVSAETKYHQEFAELNKKFEELNMRAVISKCMFEENIDKEQRKFKELEEKHFSSTETLEDKINTLDLQCKAKATAIHELQEELLESKEKTKYFGEEYTKVQEDLVESKALAETLKKSLETSEKDCEILEEKMVDLNQQNEKILFNLEQTARHKENLSESFKEVEKMHLSKIKQLMDDNENLQKEIDTFKCQFEEYESDKLVFEDKIVSLETSKQQILKERNETMEAVEKMQCEQELLKGEIVDTKENLERKNTLNSQLELELKQLKAISLEKEAAVAAYQEEINDHLSTIETMEKTIKESKEEAQILAQDLEQTKSEEEETKRKLEELKQQLDNECGENEASAVKLTEIMDEKKSTESELSSLKRQAAKIQKDFDKCKKKEGDLHTKLEKIKEQEKSHKGQISELEKKVAKLEENEEDLKNEIGELKNQLENSTGDNDKWKQNADAVQKKLSNKETKIKELEKKMSELKTENVKMTEEKDQMGKTCDEKVEEMNAILQKYKREMDSDLARAKERSQHLEKELKTVTEQVKKYEKLEVTHNALVKKSEKELKSLKNNLEAERKQLQTSKEDIAENAKTIKSLETKVAELESQLECSKVPKPSSSRAIQTSPRKVGKAADEKALERGSHVSYPTSKPSVSPAKEAVMRGPPKYMHQAGNPVQKVKNTPPIGLHSKTRVLDHLASNSIEYPGQCTLPQPTPEAAGLITTAINHARSTPKAAGLGTAPANHARPTPKAAGLGTTPANHARPTPKAAGLGTTAVNQAQTLTSTLAKKTHRSSMWGNGDPKRRRFTTLDDSFDTSSSDLVDVDLDALEEKVKKQAAALREAANLKTYGRKIAQGNSKGSSVRATQQNSSQVPVRIVANKMKQFKEKHKNDERFWLNHSIFSSGNEG